MVGEGLPSEVADISCSVKKPNYAVMMAKSKAGSHVPLMVLAKLMPSKLLAVFMQLDRLLSLMSSVSMFISFKGFLI